MLCADRLAIGNSRHHTSFHVIFALDLMANASHVACRRHYAVMRSGAVPKKKALPFAEKPAEAKPRTEAPRPRERNCSVARTVGILSDAWAFLVIREAF